jgi:hypothetical protein
MWDKQPRGIYLALDDPEEFKELTGYQMPDDVNHIACEECGVCTPDIRELIFMDNDGTVYMHTIVNCQLDTWNIRSVRWWTS